jgi:signal transduction histidine kinase/phage shock protein PspC (stress-responsive transcriptional regulator)
VKGRSRSATPPPAEPPQQPPGQPWLSARELRRQRRLMRHMRRGAGPLRRARQERMVGGVAAGLAERMGWDVTVVRCVFVLAALVSGFGAAAYVLAWLLLPMTGESGTIASKAMTDRRGITLAVALVSLLIVVLLIAAELRAGYLDSIATPLLITAAGIVLIWRNASEDEQGMIRHFAEPLIGLAEGRVKVRITLRLIIALVLAVLGITLFASAPAKGAPLQAVSGVLVVIAAIAVILGPWWLRLARDLVLERQARVRAEERADMAARVHDSVLQTLALIQRRAQDPQQVVALARAQERELRAWLFDGRAPGTLDSATTIAEGVRLIQQDVEAQHGIAVEAVTVGDCELDDDLSALLAAAREATVNAAKWSGAEVVSVFVEVEAEEVSVFVRDRGRGFDPDAVSSDRKGLAESVHARMSRRGGLARVRSAPGQGTEVSLTMPRSAPNRSAANREPGRS